MRRFLLGIVAIATALIVSGTRAVAGNTVSDTCIGAEKIAACTALIESGRLKPDDLAQAYFYRGGAHFSQSALDLAIEDFDRGLGVQPDSAEGFVGRGIVYVFKHDFDRAILDFGQAIRLKPDDPVAFINRGRTYAAKGDYVSAIRDYDQAIRLKPEDAEAYLRRSYAHAGAGDYERAAQDYEQMKRLKPCLAKETPPPPMNWWEKEFGRTAVWEPEACSRQP